MDIRNFSKSKSLSGDQALNKNSSDGKKPIIASIQFRTKKKIFRNIWP